MRLLAICAALALGAPALADDTPSAGSTETSNQKNPFGLAALKVGGVFPQVLNTLSTTYTVGLELAWITPLLNSQLALEVEVGYSGPQRVNGGTDPRLPSGGSYSYTIVERMLGVYIGPKYFILPTSRSLVPWVSLGVRIEFIDSQINGSASSGSASFGQEDETSSPLAYGGQLGLGYHLGPGFLFLEAQFLYAPLNQLITGNVNVGDLDARLGYVLTF